MAGKSKAMSQIKQLLCLYKQGNSIKRIARNLGISKNSCIFVLSKSCFYMTRIEASERTRKYNHLVGKRFGDTFIAAIMPVPVHPEVTVEEIFTIVFNHIPHDQSFSRFSDFIVAVMLNYQEFHDHGKVIWKNLDEVLEILDISEKAS